MDRANTKLIAAMWSFQVAPVFLIASALYGYLFLPFMILMVVAAMAVAFVYAVLLAKGMSPVDRINGRIVIAIDALALVPAVWTVIWYLRL